MEKRKEKKKNCIFKGVWSELLFAPFSYTELYKKIKRMGVYLTKEPDSCVRFPYLIFIFDGCNVFFLLITCRDCWVSAELLDPPGLHRPPSIIQWDFHLEDRCSFKRPLSLLGSKTYITTYCRSKTTV